MKCALTSTISTGELLANVGIAGKQAAPPAHLSEHHLPAALAHVQATPRPAFRTQRILLR